MVHLYDASMRTIYIFMNQDPQAGIQSWYDASMRTIHELGSTGWYLVMV